jgi:Flp pilus assembly pilin Flp
MKRLFQLLRCKKGAAMVEYALLVGGIALIGAASVAIFGHKTNDMIAMVAAVLPGAHTDDNAPIVSGKIIETSPGAAGVDSGGAAATGIGLDVGGIIAGTGTARLGTLVGADTTGGALADLVLEPQ